MGSPQCWNIWQYIWRVAISLQGDTSGCSPGFDDIKTNVVFLCKEPILQLNFCFALTKPGEHPDVSPCVHTQYYSSVPYHNFPSPSILSKTSPGGLMFLLIMARSSPNTDPFAASPAFLLGPLRRSCRSPSCDSFVSFRSREPYFWGDTINCPHIQGDQSGCSPGVDDNKTNVWL